jgi:hypothetical protein
MNAVDAVRVLLAGVLLFSAASKAHGGIERLAQALDRFAILPAGRERWSAAFLIAYEAVAGLLLLTPWHHGGAAIAALLTLGFTYAVSTALVRGEIFACDCFGTASRIKVSPFLLALDLILLAGALFLVATETRLWDASWQTLAIVTATTLAVGGALQSARVAFFADVARGLPEGSPAPAAMVTSASGRRHDVQDLAAAGVVIVFVTLECAACVRLLRALAVRDDRAIPVLVVTPDSAQTLIERHGCDPQWTCGGTCSRGLRRLLRIPGHPAAVVLGARRILGNCCPATPQGIVEAMSRISRAGQSSEAPLPRDASRSAWHARWS